MVRPPVGLEFGDHAKPGAEIAAFGKHITGPDGGNRGAGDDGADAWHGHQPLTRGLLPRQRFDLS